MPSHGAAAEAPQAVSPERETMGASAIEPLASESLPPEFEALRCALIDEAAKKVEAAADDIWQRGMKAVTANLEKRAKRSMAIEAQLVEFRVQQDRLAAENAKLRSVVESLARCIAGATGE